MPLYSNTTTGNNQVTYTPSEQVTKILPYDSADLTKWTSFPELSIPLGPHQRVIGTIEGWYDATAAADLYIRPKLSNPNDPHSLDTADNNYKKGVAAFNVSAATKVIVNTNEDDLQAPDSDDQVLLNLTFVDTDTNGEPQYVEIDTGDSNSSDDLTGNKYFRLSFKVSSKDDTQSELRFQFTRNSATCTIENGTRITYTKY